MNNSYPEHIVDRVIKDTLDRKDQPVDKTSTKNYVTIHLPWLGRVSNGFPWDISTAIDKGFLNTQLRVVFSTSKGFSG